MEIAAIWRRRERSSWSLTPEEVAAPARGGASLSGRAWPLCGGMRCCDCGGKLHQGFGLGGILEGSKWNVLEKKQKRTVKTYSK